MNSQSADICNCEDWKKCFQSVAVLVKERDSALEGKKAAELRASVYREGWIKAEKSFRKSIDKVVPYVQHELVVCEIESEAARIMKEKGGE